MSNFITNAELCIEAERLCDENDQLRELVRDMWKAGAFEPGACYAKEADELEKRTRKFGIKVDFGVKTKGDK